MYARVHCSMMYLCVSRYEAGVSQIGFCGVIFKKVLFVEFSICHNFFVEFSICFSRTFTSDDQKNHTVSGKKVTKENTQHTLECDEYLDNQAELLGQPPIYFLPLTV